MIAMTTIVGMIRTSKYSLMNLKKLANMYNYLSAASIQISNCAYKILWFPLMVAMMVVMMVDQLVLVKVE